MHMLKTVFAGVGRGGGCYNGIGHNLSSASSCRIEKSKVLGQNFYHQLHKFCPCLKLQPLIYLILHEQLYGLL